MRTSACTIAVGEEMSTQESLSGWPDPWSPLSKETAGKLINVSADTIQRAVNVITNGEPPKRANGEAPKRVKPQVLKIAKLFAEAGTGGTVNASLVYDVLGVEWRKIVGPIVKPPIKIVAAKPRSARQTVLTEKVMAVMTDGQLQAKLSGELDRVRGGGRIPWKAIKALADELSARGKPPGGALGGQPIARIDLSKCETWGFVGVFAAQAEPGDLWPFILPLQGWRPVDLFSATEDDIKYGYFVALTLEEWTTKLSEAIHKEKQAAETISEAEEIERVVKK